MKKLLLSCSLFILLLSSTVSNANDGMDKLLVSGGQGSLLVEELNNSKVTITVKNTEGQLILSETINSETGKLQLLGLKTGFYDVIIQSKKNSKSFHVEVK